MSAKASLTSQDFSLGIASQDAIATAINKAYEASIINGEDIRASLKQAEERCKQDSQRSEVTIDVSPGTI